MKTYRAFVTLPNIGQTPVTIEARSTYEAKEKLEAQYGKGMSPIHTRCSLRFVMPTDSYRRVRSHARRVAVVTSGHHSAGIDRHTTAGRSLVATLRGTRRQNRGQLVTPEYRCNRAHNGSASRQSAAMTRNAGSPIRP